MQALVGRLIIPETNSLAAISSSKLLPLCGAVQVVLKFFNSGATTGLRFMPQGLIPQRNQPPREFMALAAAIRHAHLEESGLGLLISARARFNPAVTALTANFSISQELVLVERDGLLGNEFADPAIRTHHVFEVDVRSVVSCTEDPLLKSLQEHGDDLRSGVEHDMADQGHRAGIVVNCQRTTGILEKSIRLGPTFDGRQVDVTVHTDG